MADLGAIGLRRSTAHKIVNFNRVFNGIPKRVAKSHKRKLPIWIGKSQSDLLLDLSGTLPTAANPKGLIKNNGVPVPYVWVALYYRKTGALIRRMQTDANGEFRFTDLVPGVSDYYMVATTEIADNAQVFDKLTAG